MKHKISIIILLLAVLAAPCAALLEEMGSAAAQVTVTDVAVEPAVYMRDDEGTVTVEITNNGQEAVPITRVTLTDRDITVLEEGRYDSVGTLGAGNKLVFTFTIRADTKDGIYYPKFTVDFRNAPSLRYRIPVKVESSELEVSVVDQPDAYAEGKKETITLLVGNPRENTVNGITVVPMGENVGVTQSSYFIGALNRDESAEVAFEITPYASTNLTFHTTYRNGLNQHVTDLVLPIVTGEGKKVADPLLNNVEVSSAAGVYTISGDVTNAGLESAKSVVITTSDPAVPVEPNRLYVVGALDPDDFSSFEVTFRAEDAESVPVIIEYKDDDGNLYSKTVDVGIDSQAAGEDEEELPVTLIVVVVVVVVAIAGIIAYSWKRK